MVSYKTSELAQITGIHPNTIRFYEKLGFIARAERLENNYRVFNEKHVYQVEICRLVFNNGFANKYIRKASLKIIEAAVKWDITLCQKCAYEYLSIIQNEISRALKTVDLLKKWMEDNLEVVFGGNYDREAVAQIVGTTKESIRNWERNGLITPKFSERYKRRRYSDLDINRMRIIYMLLQTGYSLSIVRHCLYLYDEGYKAQVLDTLVGSDEIDDIVTIGERWLEVLQRAEQRSHKIIELLNVMITL